MPGASLRNAIPQRPHRERAQQKSREKLGILEKHKDYSARARDYNAKKARLKILRQKAVDRNPDEFHFGMMSSRTKNGVKVADRGIRSLNHDVVSLMKTQDAGYLRTVRERVRRERERIEESIQLAGSMDKTGSAHSGMVERSSKSNQHTVFVNDVSEQKEFDAATWFETDDQGLKTTYNRPRKSSTTVVEAKDDDSERPHRMRNQRSQDQIQKEKRRQSKRAALDKELRIVKLDALTKQESALLEAEQELDRQRAQMSNSSGGVNQKGVKFKVRERKK